MAASDIRNFRKLTYQLVATEERSVNIRNLIQKGVGFREEEEFYLKFHLQKILSNDVFQNIFYQT